MSKSDELAALRERIAELEARVAELEGGGGQTTSNGYGDWRDQAVIEQLDAGETVGLQRLQALYRHHGDLTNDKTIKTRIRNLTQAGPFESAGTQSWTFVDGAGAMADG